MAGTWHGLTNQPAFHPSTMLLLTDGRVMVQEEATPHWHVLTPDSSGSYLDGTWSTLADMSFWRRYYASGILKDGRVIVVGGEQSGDGDDSRKGEIYDPVQDSWMPIALPPWSQVGDASSCILPDGRLMIAALDDGECLIYDPDANAWSAAASKSSRANEETWVLQPDGTILTAQTFSPFESEKYVISSDTWQSEGALPVSLVDRMMNEIGPAMLLYNGKTIFFGAANVDDKGKTAIYSPPAIPTGVGTWAAGPDIPTVDSTTMVSNDCPATLLTNGNVLFTAAPFVDGNWGSPIYFFEYDPVANTINPVPTPPDNMAKLFWSRMLLLPTGEALFSPAKEDMQLYRPLGGPMEAWRPTISSVTAHLNALGIGYWELTGTQLNGLSQANIYGDDCSNATNYPLVRLRNLSTGHISYARTYGFSTMGVATAGTLQSLRFTVGGIPPGNYELTAVANGIASHGVHFIYEPIRKLEILDNSVLKREFEYLGKIVYEGDPWRRWEVVDPEIVELRTQVKSLTNSVRRLETLIERKQLPEVGKRVAAEALRGERQEDEAEDEEDEGRRGNDPRPCGGWRSLGAAGRHFRSAGGGSPEPRGARRRAERALRSPIRVLRANGGWQPRRRRRTDGRCQPRADRAAADALVLRRGGARIPGRRAPCLALVLPLLAPVPRRQPTNGRQPHRAGAGGALLAPPGARRRDRDRAAHARFAGHPPLAQEPRARRRRYRLRRRPGGVTGRLPLGGGRLAARGSRGRRIPARVVRWGLTPPRCDERP